MSSSSSLGPALAPRPGLTARCTSNSVSLLSLCVACSNLCANLSDNVFACILTSGYHFNAALTESHKPHNGFEVITNALNDSGNVFLSLVPSVRTFNAHITIFCWRGPKTRFDCASCWQSGPNLDNTETTLSTSSSSVGMNASKVIISNTIAPTDQMSMG